MVEYICKICNYNTKNKNNYCRHNTSNKHLNNVSDVIGTSIVAIDIPNKKSRILSKNKEHNNESRTECKYCSTTFTRVDSLNRHLNKCSLKIQQEDKLRDKIKELESENQAYKSENKIYKSENQCYKQLLKEAGTIVKKSVSAMTFASNNYSEAPSIKKITLEDIKGYEPDTTKMAEHILFSYKHKILAKYLGDIILHTYKKDDPTKQSIWNTDDSRVTYIIKMLLVKNTTNWVVDKKGVKTSTYIINPLLQHIKGILNEYNKNTKLDNIKYNREEMEAVLDNSRALLKLVGEIDDGVICSQILKYISKNLRLNTKLLKDK